MFAHLSRVIVLFAAVQILGGHWFALKSVAWIGMMASYARGETLVVAFEKTFDGEHPCALCKAVDAGRDAEKKQQPETKIVWKIEGVLAPAVAVPVPGAVELKYRPTASLALERTTVPPTPPPLA